MALTAKSRAIVLHTTRQGDSSLVVHVLDAVAGRQGLYLRGLGKGRNGAATAAFHPLSVLEVVTAATPRSSLLYLREYEPVFPLNNLRTDIRRSATAQFVCEVLWRTLRTGDGDPELFAWLVESIVALDRCPSGMTCGIANFAAWWLVGYCARMGFKPEDNRSAETPLFDIVSGRFQPRQDWIPAGTEEAVARFSDRRDKSREESRLAGETSPASSVPTGRRSCLRSADSPKGSFRPREANKPEPVGTTFSDEESLLLHKLLTLSFEEAMALPLSATRRSAFSRRMLDYLSYHLGQSLDIRSLDVLHAVFSD